MEKSNQSTIFMFAILSINFCLADPDLKLDADGTKYNLEIFNIFDDSETIKRFNVHLRDKHGTKSHEGLGYLSYEDLKGESTTVFFQIPFFDPRGRYNQLVFNGKVGYCEPDNVEGWCGIFHKAKGETKIGDDYPWIATYGSWAFLPDTL